MKAELVVQKDEDTGDHVLILFGDMFSIPLIRVSKNCTKVAVLATTICHQPELLEGATNDRPPDNP